MRILLILTVSLLAACGSTPPQHSTYLLRSDQPASNGRPHRPSRIPMRTQNRAARHPDHQKRHRREQVTETEAELREHVRREHERHREKEEREIEATQRRRAEDQPDRDQHQREKRKRRLHGDLCVAKSRRSPSYAFDSAP